VEDNVDHWCSGHCVCSTASGCLFWCLMGL